MMQDLILNYEVIYDFKIFNDGTSRLKSLRYTL